MLRKREEHLPKYIEAITKHQLNNSQEKNKDYGILIVEQDDSALFNRAKLMNIGAKFANLHFQEMCSNQSEADENLCLIFHDIDMLPLNSELQYDCQQR